MKKKQNQDMKLLKREYWEKNRTLEYLALECGCVPSTIQRWLKMSEKENYWRKNED